MFFDTTQAIYQRDDSSFVVTKNEMPYHVPNEEGFESEWKEIAEYISEHGITPLSETTE